MFLLSKARSFLPDYISSETQFSIRAATGALSAAAFSLNPLAGVLAIAGHATWEYFTLFVSPSDNQIMS